jgi:hypothetical protein
MRERSRSRFSRAAEVADQFGIRLSPMSDEMIGSDHQQAMDSIASELIG